MDSRIEIESFLVVLESLINRLTKKVFSVIV